MTTTADPPADPKAEKATVEEPQGGPDDIKTAPTPDEEEVAVVEVEERSELVGVVAEDVPHVASRPRLDYGAQVVRRVPPAPKDADAVAAGETAGEAPTPDPYPEDGTVDDVVAWVGYDPERAKAAITAEHGRDKPRTTLLEQLSERTG